jgi:uncharacterized protein involved in type VI secretion and phage assembly
MLKLNTHSGLNEWFRFWYVEEYKYGSILWLEDGNSYLPLRTMSYTIYAAKFEQTIIHQHVHLRRESQLHAPAHVLMRSYTAKEGRHVRLCDNTRWEKVYHVMKTHQSNNIVMLFHSINQSTRCSFVYAFVFLLIRVVCEEKDNTSLI